MEHSTPVNSYPKLQELTRGHEVPFVKPEVVEPEASPSIHLLVKGKSYLSKELGIDDSDKIQLVDKFLNSKIKTSNLKDDSATYKTMLQDIKKSLGLTKSHESEFVLDKLYNYILGGFLNPSDQMILLNLLIGEKRNAR